MIRASAAAAILLFASIAGATALLDGRWAFSREDCQRAPGTSDRAPLTIAGNRLDFFESVCEIAAIEAIGTQDSAWRVERTCSGEGERWTVRSIFAIDHDTTGSPRQLIEINLDTGYVIVRQRCD
jgi:hypothetical protein